MTPPADRGTTIGDDTGVPPEVGVPVERAARIGELVPLPDDVTVNALVPGGRGCGMGAFATLTVAERAGPRTSDADSLRPVPRGSGCGGAELAIGSAGPLAERGLRGGARGDPLPDAGDPLCDCCFNAASACALISSIETSTARTVVPQTAHATPAALPSVRQLGHKFKTSFLAAAAAAPAAGFGTAGGDVAGGSRRGGNGERTEAPAELASDDGSRGMTCGTALLLPSRFMLGREAGIGAC